MAVEKFMLDADGKHLLDADGKMAIHEDCCCQGAPCSDCYVDQPDAAVTVSGTCTDQSDCEAAAGTYVYSLRSTAGGVCQWTWNLTPDPACAEPPGGISLTIKYDPAAEAFKAAVYAHGTGGCGQRFGLNGGSFADVTSDLTCNKANSRITGTFDLPGEYSTDDCSGCTATVTVG